MLFFMVGATEKYFAQLLMLYIHVQNLCECPFMYSVCNMVSGLLFEVQYCYSLKENTANVYFTPCVILSF